MQLASQAQISSVSLHCSLLLRTQSSCRDFLIKRSDTQFLHTWAAWPCVIGNKQSRQRRKSGDRFKGTDKTRTRRGLFWKKWRGFHGATI